MKDEKQKGNKMSKKVKIEMCGDDKTIPKSVHKQMKIYSDHFLDIDYDLKWKDAYAILSNFYKQGVKDGKEKQNG